MGWCAPSVCAELVGGAETLDDLLHGHGTLW